MNHKKYKHIFFDLDRTLWDFDKNANETFIDIYNNYSLAERGIDNFGEFINVYQKINLELWDKYRNGQIIKEALNVQRFALALNSFGIADNNLASNIAEDYIRISPTKSHLFPDTFVLLDYLSHKYNLHIITNGFAEVQHRKMALSKLDQFFINVITSEDAGFKKPDVNIFKYALSVARTTPSESLMIGDDIDVDIYGAKKAGIDQILVDYEGSLSKSISTYYVNSLIELITIL